MTMTEGDGVTGKVEGGDDVTAALVIAGVAALLRTAAETAAGDNAFDEDIVILGPAFPA
jgi:hypothetical protein